MELRKEEQKKPQKRHREEKIIYALKQIEGGAKGMEICRELGISEPRPIHLEEEIRRDGSERITAAQTARGRKTAA